MFSVILEEGFIMWLLSALASSFFAGLTAILAKCGIQKTDSDVATAIRTIVVLLFSWVMVGVVGSLDTISSIGSKSLLFLILSGLATGTSWICYFKALSMASVNKVVPIDKSSTLLTVGMAILLFQETNHLLAKLVGMLLIGIGVFMMIEMKKTSEIQQKKHWMTYAVLSAVFAALTSILAKVGIQGVESNLGTAIRTIVVLVMAWFIVFSKGKLSLVKKVDKKNYCLFAYPVLRQELRGFVTTMPYKTVW